MEKEFIPYNQALILKELGFDDNCFAYYEFGTLIYSNNPTQNKELICNCIAPLYQQTFRWFREKYNLLHEITGIHSTEPFELDCRTLNIYNGDTWVLSYRGNSYEEAELACLNKLIEIVKNK